MDTEAVLRIVLYTVLISLGGVSIWAVREVVLSVRSTRRFYDQMHATVPGLIERADATLGAINSELVRVNGVVSQLEEVSDRVTSTTRAAQEMVEGPVAVVTNVAEGARRFLGALFRG
jgi:ABC-type Fe2+-enterobactin transport system substrate-binding protein